jgi:hypothetical protein
MWDELEESGASDYKDSNLPIIWELRAGLLHHQLACAVSIA